MAVVYNLSKKDGLSGEGAGLYYPHAKSTGMVGMDDLCREISGRCSLRRPMLMAAVSALSEAMMEHLSDGEIVDLGALGRFQVSCSGAGVERAGEFDARRHIRSVKVVYRPAKDLKQRMKLLKFKREETE